MLPDRVSNPGLLTYESGALPIALRGPAAFKDYVMYFFNISTCGSHKHISLISRLVVHINLKNR